MRIRLKINGEDISAEVEADVFLVDLLRERLRLTGTHVGCDTAQCGACTVLVDGRAVKSCTVLAAQADGGQVVTIEGLAGPGGTMHPMQSAFRRHHGLQCGFCTPGIVMSALELAALPPDALTDARIRAELSGNLCRCTGYLNIVASVRAGVEAMHAAGTGPGSRPLDGPDML